MELVSQSLFYGKKPKYRDYLFVPSSESRVNPTLKMGQINSPETLGSYHKIITPGKNPKAFKEVSISYKIDTNLKVC